MAMYDDQMDPAFGGMKADAGDDRVETFPAGTNGIAFGVVGGTDANGLLVPGPGTRVRGITVHSHAVRGAALTGTDHKYAATEAVSVMTRGLIWARVTSAGSVTDGGAVSFAADGTVANAGANVLANAQFRSGAVTTADGVIAVVELHNPFSETDTVA